jgi:hypothetical protein
MMSDFPMSNDDVVRYTQQGGELPEDQFETLYQFYLSNGEMPYGVAKCRTGDPYSWIDQQLHLRARDIGAGFHS